MAIQIKIIAFLLIQPFSIWAAVHLSTTGQGQAISVPFYSVAPEMTTLISITNNADTYKALKIHIKESNNLSIIKSFNVYLKPQGITTLGMLNRISESNTIDLINSGNDMSSCVIGVDYVFGSSPVMVPENLDWWEWQTGVLEIIEMGELQTAVGSALFAQDGSGVCSGFNSSWNDSDGYWQNNPNHGILPANGGLSATVSLVDVGNGNALSVEPLVFANFYPNNSTSHTRPEAETPNLSSGTKDSLVVHNGQAIMTRWPTGYEAISALLMKTNLSNEFQVLPSIGGQSEWVVSFPTWGYHKNATDGTIPFRWNEGFGAFAFPTHASVHDQYRNNVVDPNDYFCIGNVPCYLSKSAGVFTFTLLEHFEPLPELSFLAGQYLDPTGKFVTRENHELLITETAGLGHANFSLFAGDSQTSQYSLPNTHGKDPFTNQTHTYYGLPAVGFSAIRFFNSNAQPGKLAVYGTTSQHRGERHIEVLDE
ncbi:MAG: hypothetical protein ACSHWU_03705 [Marinicella sp.]